MSILFVTLATFEATGLPAPDNSDWFEILLKIVETPLSWLFALAGSAPSNNYLLGQKFV